MKIVINPPPSDSRCECCGKHVSELKPFGGPGDPLVGDFNGALLVKTFRDNGGCVGASWECRDCFVLSDEEFRKIVFRFDDKNKNSGEVTEK